MKILELGKFYAPHRGGIETLLRSWCEGFVQRGAEVDCVVANGLMRSSGQTINGVRVHRLASYGTMFSTSVCPGYLNCTRRYPADIWHVHFPNPLADLACLRGDSGTPLIVSYHSDVVRQAWLMKYYAPLMKRFLDRADRIVVATPQQLEYSPWLGPYRDKCEVIPFGIKLERFTRTAETSQLAAAYHHEGEGRPILLTVGRLVGYKGHRYLLEAVQHLDVTVWMVGTGPLEAELKQLADELGVTPRVRFWGGLDDREVVALLHACDIFVLPSVTPNEAFGIVQVEAMACGKPVISCDLPSGVPYVNQHGVTGIIVPPADAEALAQALSELLGNTTLSVRLGEAGRRRAEEEFNEELMLDHYWRLLKRLKGSQPA
jgi:glycosyltransferase involved in cell wall biosynthesis